MTDLAFCTATTLTAALRSREVGSRELLDHLLERVERLNPHLNAVVTLDAERAQAAARRADEASARGETAGPLHGLPMTVKESFEVEGLRTTSGSPELADHVSATDADAVARLRSAGAVVFGKTNVPLFTGDIQTYNDVFGTTNNPWDPARGPGGSSGGAAAALAAGLTPLELGSDIGGSIRNPAHFCGVFGHKPSYGIVPLRGHVPGPPGALHESDISVAGPLAVSADDLDLALSVLGGPDPQRAVAWRLELPPPRHSALADYRLAAWLDDEACPVDAAVGDVLAGAVSAVQAAGASVDETARPAVSFGDAAELFQRLLHAVLGAGLPAKVYDRLTASAASGPPPGGGADLRSTTAANMTQSFRAWAEADEARQAVRAAWAELFTRVDALVCPTVAVAAFPHDHDPDVLGRTLSVNGQPRPYLEAGVLWAGLAGMALLPATVVPVGLTPGGLPVGLQVIGPFLEDRTTIDVARGVAEVVGPIGHPPIS